MTATKLLKQQYTYRYDIQIQGVFIVLVVITANVLLPPGPLVKVPPLKQ